MASTRDELLREIAHCRYLNKDLYVLMDGLIKDRTLWIVEGAYRSNPAEAKRLHGMILTTDEEILKLSRELMECE